MFQGFLCAGSQKQLFENEKAAILNEKQLFQDGKTVVSDKKQLFENKINESRISSCTVLDMQQNFADL